jgi:hypothetical protein
MPMIVRQFCWSAYDAIVERGELVEALKVRGDLACERAALALRRGIQIHEGWGMSKPLALVRHFSANADGGWEDPHVEVFGHENSMNALRGCPLPLVETVSLEDMPKERWFIHLAPDSREVVACHGVVLAPRRPLPVYQRGEVPVTIAEAAAAFSTYEDIRGQPRPFEVTVRQELTQQEAKALYATWPKRMEGWYRTAKTITVLAAAEVWFRDPRGQALEGQLLILDIAADPEVPRHRYGRVDAILLTVSRGAPHLRVVMVFDYEAAGSRPTEQPPNEDS